MRLVTLWGAICFAAFCGAMPVVTEVALAQTGRAANGVGTPFELSFWHSVDGSGDPAQYDEYLRQYPNGTFSALARIKIASLRRNAEPQGAPVQPISPPARAVAQLPALNPEPISAPMPASSSTPLATAALAEPERLPTAIAEGTSIPIAASVTAPGLIAPQPVPQPVPQPAPSVQTSELAALLAILAASQESSMANPPAKLGKALEMPPRPKLVPVPMVSLPDVFCSANARNAFHDEIYQPAIAAAKGNGEATSRYLRQLQFLYDSYLPNQEYDALNALALEARVFQPEAANAFAVQSALVEKFSALMAVPIQLCKVEK